MRIGFQWVGSHGWRLSRATAHVATRMSAFTGAQRNPKTPDKRSATRKLAETGLWEVLSRWSVIRKAKGGPVKPPDRWGNNSGALTISNRP